MRIKLKDPHSVKAMVHSKKTVEEVTLIETGVKPYSNDYVCITKDGVKCTAIYNCFTGLYYADDLYGVIEDYRKDH